MYIKLNFIVLLFYSCLLNVRDSLKSSRNKKVCNFEWYASNCDVILLLPEVNMMRTFIDRFSRRCSVIQEKINGTMSNVCYKNLNKIKIKCSNRVKTHLMCKKKQNLNENPL